MIISSLCFEPKLVAHRRLNLFLLQKISFLSSQNYFSPRPHYYPPVSDLTSPTCVTNFFGIHSLISYLALVLLLIVELVFLLVLRTICTFLFIHRYHLHQRVLPDSSVKLFRDRQDFVQSHSWCRLAFSLFFGKASAMT